MNHTTYKTILARLGPALVLILLLGLVSTAMFSRSCDSEDGVPQSAQSEQASGEREHVGWEATRVVRILLEPRQDPMSDSSAKTGDPILLGEFPHAGAIDSSAREATLQNFLDSIKRLSSRLDSVRGTGSVEEARITREILLRHHAIHALETGQYITTRQGDLQPPSSIAGADVLCTGATVRGEYVDLALIFPHALYPDLENALQHFRLAQHFEDWTRAERFNALPEAERLAIAKEISRLRKQDNISSEELSFIYNKIGRGVTLNAETGVVTVEPLR